MVCFQQKYCNSLEMQIINQKYYLHDCIPSLYKIGTLSTVSGDLLFIAISKGLPRLNKDNTSSQEGAL
jgi:hypothetical protein